ncbi:hypothetical protein SS50377_25064 [Spironucleus salmonicida]|uniref:Transmembrane protein n=1 Tax=Spironucleus salmonicida TaxID=348837 RepID=V6LF12_9EUKA|nr:hypothetical protein SS50377_25064 [Spironucleus salmonicida]|eukprot:EST43125.1 Hypothetical protein SS50377_17284 [Spironucleus salmonicida]
MKTLTNLKYSFVFNQISSEFSSTVSTLSMEFYNHEQCFSEVYIVPDLVQGVYTITFPKAYLCRFEQVDVDIQMHIYPDLVWTHRIKNYNQSLVQYQGLAVECIDQSYSYEKCIADVYSVYFEAFFTGFIRLVTYNEVDPDNTNPNLKPYETIIQQEIQGIRAISYKNFYKELIVNFQGDKIHFTTTLLNASAFNTTEQAFVTLCVQESKNFTEGRTWVFEQQMLLFDFYQPEFWIDCTNASNVTECKKDLILLQLYGQSFIYNMQVAFMHYNFSLMEIYFDRAVYVPTCVNSANLLRRDNQFCITINYLTGCDPGPGQQLPIILYVSNDATEQYNVSLYTGSFFYTSMEVVFPSSFCYPVDAFKVTFNSDSWGMLNFAGTQIPIVNFSVERTNIVQIEGICFMAISLFLGYGGYVLALKSGPGRRGAMVDEARLQG